MRAKMDIHLSLCFGVDLGPPGLKSPSKHGNFARPCRVGIGWEVKLLTHVHLGLSQLVNTTRRPVKQYRRYDTGTSSYDEALSQRVEATRGLIQTSVRQKGNFPYS